MCVETVRGVIDRPSWNSPHRRISSHFSRLMPQLISQQLQEVRSSLKPSTVRLKPHDRGGEKKGEKGNKQ